MSASLSGIFNLQQFTDAGVLMVGGRIYTYAYGTTTHKAAYTNHEGTVPHTYTSDGIGGLYIATNARGELPEPLFLTQGSYDIALKNPDGSTEWTRRADPVFDIANDLAGPGGSALIVDTPSSPGAISTNLFAQARQRISVVDNMSTAQKADYFSRAKTLDCTAAIQSVEDYIESLGGGEMYWPIGTARHDSTINRKTGVTWRGRGKSASRAVYFGSTVAYNCVGTSVARKQLSFQNMSLEASSSANNSQCINLGWNQRGESFDFVHRVKIAGFGDYGINFTDSNWLVQFWDLEMVECGRNVSGSSGIYKAPTVDNMGIIRFWGGAIENCGTNTSEAGALYMPSNGITRMSGLYFHGTDIEGNYAKDLGADVRVQNGDVFFVGVDMESTNSGGFKKQNVIFDNCAQASLIGCRLGAQPAFAAHSVSALNGTVLTVEASTEFNQNHTLNDVYVDATSKAYVTNLQHRVTLASAATSKVFGRQPTIQAMGQISDGRLGVAGFYGALSGMTSCVRTGAGIYVWTWAKPCQDVGFSVAVSGDAITTGAGMIFNERQSVRTNSSCTIYTSFAGVLTDCEGMSIAITHRLIA